MSLARYTEPDRPWTRRAFSKEFAAGRAWLQTEMRLAGLTPVIDAAGNLIGRAEGREAAAGTIMVGSHSDTVAGGGRFDGIAGVIAGLEVAAALKASGRRLRHALEIVDFLAEEPNDFGLSCIGSRGMAGQLEPQMLERVSPAGFSLKDSLAAVGAPAKPVASAVRSDLAAFFELHIEQGPVLEQTGREIGIVTHIVGIRRLRVRFAGQASHAGTTPFALRQDALVAAARFVTSLRQAVERAHSQGPFVIATVGELTVVPNAPNVVPGEVRVTVDVRSEAAPELERWSAEIETLARAACGRDARLAECTLLSASLPSACAPALAEVLRQAVTDLKLTHQDIVSGAGHDAAFVARVAPAAMLFVPSRGGLSHSSEEWTEPEALAKGVAVLLRAVERFGATGDDAGSPT